jgi:methionyl-tRNA synthetase
MYRDYWFNSQPWAMVRPGMAILLGLLVVWSIVWKGLALWKSARRGQSVWFVVFMVVNTFGILEILYIYVFSKSHTPGEPVHSNL